MRMLSSIKEAIDKQMKFSTYEIKVLGARLFDTLDFPGGDLVTYTDDWWTRRSGYIASDGSVISDIVKIAEKQCCVRPVLIISIDNTDFSIGDTFIFFGTEFKIMSNSTAFCVTDIGKCDHQSIEEVLNKWIDNALSVYTANRLSCNAPEQTKHEKVQESDEKEFDYRQKILAEYKELSERIDELDRFYRMQLNNQRPHLKQLDIPKIKYPISLVTKQYSAMREYQLYLQLRLIIEGINPEDYTPGEEFDF